ncbi:MAG: ZIP family metal transporter [Candidatus Omnitrophica bacterium]|nr:ZIP family metal transporter [Candidatus Omnitrophota bacterium]MBU4346215.1 ZIP family metal transporter [Candidatus Omnitrophota bacterium]MBU4473351.1 ZIP family metal transporter [Candidatus Omnitrophota bacterium]MCG2707015.1 ZIP family metal transporter [Candidatus Omnitrophota bacterium]
MENLLQNIHPIILAFIAGFFTWVMTAFGAAIVFLTKEINRKLLDVMLGFAAGVMSAAIYWSMLAPAMKIAAARGLAPWFPATVGFLIGGIFLRGIDKILPHLPFGFPIEEAEGIKTPWRRSTLLVLAMTLHNIPEGLAIGIAFGAIAVGSPSTTLHAAIALAIGIGIQDIPEGLAVSLPLRREGVSRLKSFWYGQLSGIVEPVAAVIGAAAVILAQNILPYTLAFAAGAMFFIVVEEIIPESQRGGNADLATMGTIVGFVVMMILGTAFG